MNEEEILRKNYVKAITLMIAGAVWIIGGAAIFIYLHTIIGLFVTLVGAIALIAASQSDVNAYKEWNNNQRLAEEKLLPEDIPEPPKPDELRESERRSENLYWGRSNENFDVDQKIPVKKKKSRRRTK